MPDKYQKLLILEKGRIFIDIAYTGCGSGCKYCYVPSSSEKQEVAPYSDFEKIVKILNEYGEKDKYVISFCPNTEPFKSKESIARVLWVLQELHRDRFYFQISTKEYISDSLLEKLNILAKESTIFINVSIPFLETQRIEPGAATRDQRVSNIVRIRNYSHLRSGLYIKPCTSNAVDNAERYISIINKVQPDYVCVGVSFDDKTNIPCASLHREDDAAKIISVQKKLFVSFAEEIKRSAQCPIVYSSICAIFQESGGVCPLNLWRYDKNLCDSCNVSRDC